MFEIWRICKSLESSTIYSKSQFLDLEPLQLETPLLAVIQSKHSSGFRLLYFWPPKRAGSKLAALLGALASWVTGPVIRVNTPLGTLPQTNRVWFTTNFCCFAETTVTHLFAHLEKEETKMFSIDHPTHSILANFWNLTLDRPSMGAPEKSARGRQQIQLREQCAAGHPTPSLQDRLWPKDKPLSLTQTPFCPVPIVGDSIKMALFLLLSFARAFPDLPISKDGTRVHEKDFSRFFFLLENIQKTFEVCLFGPPKRSFAVLSKTRGDLTDS